MQIAIDFNATYPPHQRHSATSRASAAAAAPKFSMRTHGLLAVIGQHPAGLTDEEGQALMSIDGNSYRPMRVTLMRHGTENEVEPPGCCLANYPSRNP